MAFEISNYVGRTLSQRLLLLLFIIYPIASLLLSEYQWRSSAQFRGVDYSSHVKDVCLIIFSSLISLIYNVDALRSRNMLQIKFNWISMVLMMVLLSFLVAILFLAGNIFGSAYYVLAILAEVLVVALVYAILERKIEREIGWDVYKIVGASVEAQAMWKTYQKYLVALKAFCVNFPYPYLTMLLHATFDGTLPWTYCVILSSGLVAYVGMIACIPASLYACRTESRRIMNSILVFYLLSLVALIAQAFILGFLTFLFLGAIFVVWLCFLLYYVAQVRGNFGKGMIQYYENADNALKRTGTIRSRHLNLEDDDQEPEEKKPGDEAV